MGAGLGHFPDYATVLSQRHSAIVQFTKPATPAKDAAPSFLYATGQYWLAGC